MTAVATKKSKKTESLKSNNATVRFASKLYPKLGESNENSFYSPFSLLSALGMCTAGSKGNTHKCLSELLETPVGADESKQYFASLVAEITGDGIARDYELTTANALWIQKDLALVPGYTSTVIEDYGGLLTDVDYEEAPEAAVTQINNWCNEATNGKIPTIITRDFINSDTRLILTNAIYFKGKWAKSFQKDATYNENFKDVGSVPTMHQTSSFSYMENDLFQALELDYQGDDLSMLVILPKGNELDDDLETVYETATIFLHHEEKVVVSLPRFKMETKYQMKDVLCELGAGLAFSNNADFSGITEQESLKISDVVHKAYVDCNEEGTEAAAVTAVGMMRCTSMRPVDPPKVFKADHPFVFFIRNKTTGNILFSGRVVNPA